MGGDRSLSHLARLYGLAFFVSDSLIWGNIATEFKIKKNGVPLQCKLVKY